MYFLALIPAGVALGALYYQNYVKKDIANHTGDSYIGIKFGSDYSKTYQTRIKLLEIKGSSGGQVSFHNIDAQDVVIRNNDITTIQFVGGAVHHMEVAIDSNWDKLYLPLWTNKLIINTNNSYYSVYLNAGHQVNILSGTLDGTIPNGITTMTYHEGDMHMILLKNIYLINDYDPNIPAVMQYKIVNRGRVLKLNIISILSNTPVKSYYWTVEDIKDKSKLINDILDKYNHNLNPNFRHLRFEYVSPGIFDIKLNESPEFDIFHPKSDCHLILRLYITVDDI